MPRSTQDYPARANELPALQITNWPLRQQPRFVMFAACAIVVMSLIALWALQNRLAGLAVCIILLLTTWRMWIPIRYQLDSRGVQTFVGNRRSQMPWSRIARYEVDPHGILLLHQQDAFPLTALRGTYIYSSSEHEDLLKLIEFYCP